MQLVQLHRFDNQPPRVPALTSVIWQNIWMAIVFPSMPAVILRRWDSPIPGGVVTATVPTITLGSGATINGALLVVNSVSRSAFCKLADYCNALYFTIR